MEGGVQVAEGVGEVQAVSLGPHSGEDSEGSDEMRGELGRFHRSQGKVLISEERDLNVYVLLAFFGRVNLVVKWH